MSSILCLWKHSNYSRDVKEGLVGSLPMYHSNQRRLHTVTDIGDRAYLVTCNEDRCYLVSRVTIHEKRIDNSKYGQYCIVGDIRDSAYFPYATIDVTDVVIRYILRKAHLPRTSSGQPEWPIPIYLQRFRELSEGDVLALEDRTNKAEGTTSADRRPMK